MSPVQTAGRKNSAHHLYVVRIKFNEAGLSRMDLMSKLSENGIGTQVHYIPVHYHPSYQRIGFKPDMYPEAERYYQEALSLPLFYSLSDADQDHIISVFLKLLH
jgi:dTDP-4-amino-4,6-dideoxygalactose transaminase